MPKNESTFDRVIRAILALEFAWIAWTGMVTGAWAIVLWVAAVILIITSITGFCGLYKLIGFATNKK